MNNQISAKSDSTFEDLKQVNEHGIEYWSARAIQPLFGYSQWRRFEQAIERAKISCKQSDNDLADHFADAGKMVKLGSRSSREVADYLLSRFACYLIAQNGDPRKVEIARAQQYFAIQILDRMDTTELAANQFRMTQTRDKLAQTRVNNQQTAINTHEQVGREVREAIKRIGGTMPENIPPAEHIKRVQKRINLKKIKRSIGDNTSIGILNE